MLCNNLGPDYGENPDELIVYGGIGKDADFVLWDISDPAELAYRFGLNPCQQLVRNGTIIEAGLGDSL